MKIHRSALAFVLGAICIPHSASSLPISVDAFGDPFEVFHFRDLRGVNSVGFGAADRLTYGAVNVVPNGKEGTTATASQNGVEGPVFVVSTDVNPNQFAGGVPYDPSLTGSWELVFRNGDDELTVSTPQPGDVGQIGLANGLTLSNPGLTPTLKWVNPVGAERVSVFIYDLENRDAVTGLARAIFAAGVPVSGPPTFSTPVGLLQEDHLYSFSVEASTVYGGGVNPSGSSQARASRSRSRSFFDFSTGALPGDPEEVFLPQVDVSTGAPIFNFDNEVLANRIAFYDPLLAVGYDYAIGAGDPLFASFILPEVGDGVFDLFLDDGTGFQFVEEVFAGEEFSFGAGVDAFRILGIELSAGLDPNDASAFVTGLSFVADGRFTGTMTPITTDAAVVPLPATIWLMLGAIFASPIVFRRRHVAA